MPRKTKNYLVVIGDVVSSKKIPQRGSLQRRLSKGLQHLSSSMSLISPYTITLGDEFQAVYGSGNDLFRGLFTIRKLLYPQTCRFALSIGSITTAINPRQAIGMDGPAFYDARASIEILKAKKDLIALTGLSPQPQNILKSTLPLLWSSTDTWKLNRLNIMIGLLEKRSIDSLAESLDLETRSVYKNIQEGDLNRWHEWVHTVEETIADFL
ncbi:MAG: SatD family protein [Verrucomicrobiota bacterium]